MRRRDTWVPPYTALFCRGGRLCPPGSVCSLWCVGEGLSCPPSCQPTDGHCRTRQSGHFLETGSLHPPLAALRRFPLPQATARVAPTDGNKERGKAGRRGRRPLRTGTRSAVKRGVEDAASYGREQGARYGGRGRTPPLSMAAGCGGCLLLWRGQGAGGRQ